MKDFHIVTAANKGGTGKTAMAMCIASVIEKVKKREVLLVDLDPQENLTGLCSKGKDVQSGVFELLNNEECDTIELTDKIELLPATHRLKGEKGTIEQMDDTELSFALSEVDKNIVVDTNPNATQLEKMAISFADVILIVAEPDKASIQGCLNLAARIDLKNKKNRKMKQKPIRWGFIINRYVENRKIGNQLTEEIKSAYKKVPIFIVHESEALKASRNENVFIGDLKGSNKDRLMSELTDIVKWIFSGKVK